MAGKTYTANQIKKIRKKLGLSTEEFGKALGLGDPSRVVRGWECGERNGQPSHPSGSAVAAIDYLLAIRDFLRVARNTPDVMAEFGDAMRSLEAALPEPLRDQCATSSP